LHNIKPLQTSPEGETFQESFNFYFKTVFTDFYDLPKSLCAGAEALAQASGDLGVSVSNDSGNSHLPNEYFYTSSR
jgi:hypothetical protein